MRKPIVFIIFISLAISVFGQRESSSSENSDEKVSIVERIRESSNGNITVDIEDYILRILMEKGEPTVKKENEPRLRTGVNRIPGYRVQVFANGNNPSTLRSRAESRKNAVASRFPQYKGQVYTFSKGPNWYTQVGNFRSAEEANAAMQELKRAFHSFSNEMRVVKTEIVIIK